MRNKEKWMNIEGRFSIQETAAGGYSLWYKGVLLYYNYECDNMSTAIEFFRNEYKEFMV
jgi:hypothetical protein